MLAERSPTEFDIVFYHRGCLDGIAAALPFWLANKERFVPGMCGIGERPFYAKGITHAYHIERDWVEGRVVAFVDICLKAHEMEQVARHAKYLLVIDHHSKEDATHLSRLENCKIIHETNLSAAQLAWDYVCHGRERPWFIDIIGDGDLWKFALPDSRALYKALGRRYKSWEGMEELLNLLESESTSRQAELVQYGQSILEQERNPIEEHCKSALLCVCKLPGTHNLRVNLTQCSTFEWISQIGAQLAAETGIGGTYYYNYAADTWKISLRVADDSEVNVANLARRFGGGGLAKSASFYVYGHQCASLPKDSEGIVLRGTVRDYFSPE